LRDIGTISSFSRVLSLRTLLFALIGFLGVMLGAVLALNAAGARRAGVLADLASRSNSTVDLLLSAAAHWAAARQHEWRAKRGGAGGRAWLVGGPRLWRLAA
jgi:hypothetical protein